MRLLPTPKPIVIIAALVFCSLALADGASAATRQVPRTAEERVLSRDLDRWMKAIPRFLGRFIAQVQQEIVVPHP